MTLPTPKMLAKKEETSVLSLRIKSSTLSAFEKYAQSFQTTTSTIINNLLDAYIAEQEKNKDEDDIERDKKAARAVMRQYLEKIATRFGSTSDFALLNNLANNHSYSNIDAVEFQDYEYEYNSIKDSKDSESIGITLSVFMSDLLHTEFLCVSDKKASILIDDMAAIVYTPADKYPIIGNMILGYVCKNESLYGGKREQKIDVDTMERIAEAINGMDDKKELAEAVAKILADYEPLVDVTIEEEK